MDLLDEEVILSWADTASNASVKQSVAPLIKWLKEAEEEDDDEEGDDDDEEDEE